MGNALRYVVLLSALAVVGCADDGSDENPGDGGSGGSGATAGTGGTSGSGGGAGSGGIAGMGGMAMGGSGGMAGTGGSMVEPCTDDGMCGAEDDCVCPECDDDLFCRDPENCLDNGMCNEFTEGCVCADCADLPVCER